MHFRLTLKTLSLRELRALRLYSIHLLLLVTDLVAYGTRADGVLDMLLCAVDGPALVVVASPRVTGTSMGLANIVLLSIVVKLSMERQRLGGIN